MKNIIFFNLKTSVSGGEIFNIFEYACFRNAKRFLCFAFVISYVAFVCFFFFFFSFFFFFFFFFPSSLILVPREGLSDRGISWVS